MKKILFYVLFFPLFLLFVIPAKAAGNDPVDSDGDGLPDTVENALGTNPSNVDSDGDNYPDGIEVYNGYNPQKGGADRSLERSVEVDLSKQQLYFLMNGVKINSMPVSTGLPSMKTPTGTFKILRKLPVVNYIGPGYNLPNTQWNLEFKPRYYLHGAYWHNQFGIRPMSHGCVNIAYPNAKILYNFLDKGDKVVVYGVTPTKVAQR